MQGERLRAIREESGITQEELAEMARISTQQINRYENGKTEPNGEIIARLAKALAISSDYLLGLTDDPTPGYLSSDLTRQERAVLSLLRRGEKMKAIQEIAREGT